MNGIELRDMIELYEEAQRIRAREVDRKREQRARSQENQMAARARGPRPGASPGATASPPSSAQPGGGVRHGPAAGAAPFPLFDGMRMSGAEYRAHLETLGVALPPGAEFYDRPPRPPPSEVEMREAAVRAGMARLRAERVRQREGAIAATAVDGRSASPEQARARLEQLLGRGGSDPQVTAGIRTVGKPLPLQATDADRGRQATNRARQADRRVAAMVRGGEAFDASRASDDLRAARLRSLGLNDPGNGAWSPSSRTPTR